MKSSGEIFKPCGWFISRTITKKVLELEIGKCICEKCDKTYWIYYNKLNPDVRVETYTYDEFQHNFITDENGSITKSVMSKKKR